MTIQEVGRYRLPTRILHWVHTVAFIALFLTGLVLFIHAPGFLAENSWTRLIHRTAAVIFIGAPLLYLIINPKAAVRGLRQAFTWGAADLKWFRAAPRFFLLGDEKGMPPQGFLNSGQKIWWLITIVFGFAFVITGLTMWFGKTSAPSAVLNGMVFAHDIAFIVTGAMFFLHIYLGAFHPFSTEALKSMVSGKVTDNYAKAHYSKWYEEVIKGRQEKSR